MKQSYSQRPLFYKIILTLLIITALGVYCYLALINNYGKFRAGENNTTTAALNTESLYHSHLDGTAVANAAAETPIVVAVMVDNHPDARPQAGVNSARVAYEMPVEGSLTRYLLFFDANQLVEKVGPVRSARPCFLDVLPEYGAPAYLHSGGSPLALERLKNGDYFDVNEFWNGRYFWRAENRAAPHNLYTNSANWQILLNVKNSSPASWAGWKFGEWSATSTWAVRALSIAYSPDYEITWRYNDSAQQFERQKNGQPYQDENGAPITASNVALQYVTARTVDEEGRLEVEMVGTGKMIFARNGKMTRGTWEKTNLTARTRYYDENGNEVVFSPGKTWVQIVPGSARVSITS